MEMYNSRETEATMEVRVTVGEPLGVGSGTIDAGELSAERAHELAEAAKGHLVRVAGDAPSSCIDGRDCALCMDGNPTEPRPSVAGGALITAYGAAEITGWFGRDDSDTNARLAIVRDTLESQGIVIGGHCDEAAQVNGFIDPQTGRPKTGCGADDKLLEILQKPFTESETVATLTQALLDRAYSSEVTPFEQPDIKSWDPRQALHMTNEAHGGRSMEVLRKAHREKLLACVYIPDTTVDRDAFVRDTGEQIFVIDMWYIDKLAAAMAAGRPDAEVMEVNLRHAMTAYQVATYLTLCNGTQRPVFLRTAEYELAA